MITTKKMDRNTKKASAIVFVITTFALCALFLVIGKLCQEHKPKEEVSNFAPSFPTDKEIQEEELR